MIGRLPFVLFRAIFASIILMVGWRMMNALVTSDFAKLVYLDMSPTWVIAFTTIIPMMVIIAGVVWVFLPLVTHGGGDGEQDTGIIKKLFGMG